MEQMPINQRLKFLADTLSESVRAFGEAIGESPTNTHNYLSGGRKPAHEFLKKVLLRFENVNAHWLLTGEGEAFSNLTAEDRAVYQVAKKNTGNVAGINTGSMSHQAGDVNLKRELEIAQETIALLRSQLVDKERLIRVYEATIPPK